MINVAICDDMPHVCDGYKTFIDIEDDMQCIFTATSGDECMLRLEKNMPDILLLDIQMETETSGIELLDTIKDKYPGLKIIMLTGYENDDYIFSALVRGADDYIVKTLDTEALISAIRKLYSDSPELRPEIFRSFKNKSKELLDIKKNMMSYVDMMVRLSNNEFMILKDIYSGKKYKTIADEHFVEETTVKTIASRILKKLEVGSMKELIKILKDLNFFD